jgi:DNA-directed RNA polymerase subunit alpha
VIGAGETAGDTAAAQEFLSLGNRAREQGDRAEATRQYRQAVSADPTHGESLFRLAFELDLMGEEQEALVLYERAADRQPAPVNVLMNLAVMYEDMGDYRRAEKSLRQVLDTNPNHPRALLYFKDVIASKDMFIDEEHDRDIAKRNAMLDTPVTDFELSVRARNCLKKMNIRTLGDLLRVTEAELMGYKNFGEASLLEIKAMLTSKGLRLGQGLEDQHRRLRARAHDPSRGQGPSDALLNKSVGELGLSVRARKALQVLGIMSLGDLTSRTEAELMGVKNFGATSLDEVKIKLTELGLSLRELSF